jgi:hypothetical protein
MYPKALHFPERSMGFGSGSEEGETGGEGTVDGERVELGDICGGFGEGSSVEDLVAVC